MFTTFAGDPLAFLKRALLALTALAFWAGCSSDTPETTVVRENDNNKEVELWTGQILAVKLRANPTTGYMWEVADGDEKVLYPVGEVELEPESDAVGAPMTATFRFQAVTDGAVNLRLVLRRSWEKDVKPMGTFVIRVIVREQQ